MPRLNTVNPETAQGKAKLLLDGVQKSLGMTPNIMRMLANSPAALEAYLGLMRALGGASIDGKTREAIALATSGANGCDYCVAAHTALGKIAGLSKQETCDARRATASDEKESQALQFARQIVSSRGFVADEDVERVRQAGYTDGEIAEIVANVALNIFTNYFNHVADTEVDFPVAPELAPA